MVLDRMSLQITYPGYESIYFSETLDLQDSLSINYGSSLIEKKSFDGLEIVEINNTKYYVKQEKILFKGGSMNWTFYMPTDIEKPGKEKGVSLGFEKNGETNSFIHQLKAQGLIDKAIFSFIPVESLQGGLYFGEFPKKLTSYHKSFTCKVDETIAKWGCNFDSIYFQEKGNRDNYSIYPVNSYAYFQSSGPFILAPKTFIDDLEKIYFAPYLANKTCNYTNTSFGYKSFFCDCGAVLKSFPEMGIVFDGYKININPYSIFNSFGSACYFLIEFNDNNNKWVFGSGFLLYYISKFDNEDNTVTLYSMYEFEKVKFNTTFPLKIITHITLIISLIGTGICLFHKYYLLNNKGINL